MQFGSNGSRSRRWSWSIDGIFETARDVAAWRGAITLVPALLLASLGLATHGPHDDGPGLPMSVRRSSIGPKKLAIRWMTFSIVS